MRTPAQEATRPGNGHPGRRRLEQFAFNGGTPDGLSETDRRHFQRCDACREQIAQLRDQRAAFLEARPPDSFLERLEARQRRVPLTLGLRQWHVAHPWVLCRLLPVTVALVLVLGLGLTTRMGLDAEEEAGMPVNQIAFKGTDGVRFDLFVSRDRAPATLHRPDELLRPGDVVRFGVRPSSNGYLVIANIDDRGTPTIYYPPDRGVTVRIDAGEMSLLNDTIVLDHFIGAELIVAVVSETPQLEDAVIDALESAYAESGGDLGRITTLDLEGDIALKHISKVAP